MRHGGRTRRFTAPLAVLAVVLTVPAADATSLARQCRQACPDEIAACAAAGGRHLACKRQTLRRCRTEGLAACEGPDGGDLACSIERGGREVGRVTGLPRPRSS